MNIYKQIILSYLSLNVLLSSCVTFNVDISNADIPDGNYIVLMNGSWNSWGWGYELEQTEVENIFSGTFCGFNNGDYQYVHSITGDFDSWAGWGIIGNPPLGSDCDFNPNDSYQNYGFTVNNENLNIPLNLWNCCGTNYCSDWEGCYSGSIQSNDSYLYGRFEVRMKSAEGDGLVSSFFTYNTDWIDELGNLNWNEIDVEMTGNRDSSVQFTTHHPGEPNSWSYGEIIDVDFNPHSEFHNYAFEWTPEYIKWFVDDIEVYEQNQAIVDDLVYSQKICMNLWPAIWESWVGEWDENDIPKHVYYDYVKYYEYSAGNGNHGTDNDFLFSWFDDFNYYDNSIWSDNSNGTFNGNLCSFSSSNTNYYNGYLILTLTDISENLECNQIDGDINSDAVLDVLDLIIMVEIALSDSFADIQICEYLASDKDCNQILNIIDLVLWVEFIIN